MVRYVRSGAAFALPGFSPAVHVPSGLIFVSGQVAIGTDGRIVGKWDFEAQIELTIRNLESVLSAAGATLRNIVKLNIVLSDRTYVSRWRELRQKYFSEPYPASTLIVAGLISEDLLVEIEAVAYLPPRTSWSNSERAN